MTAKKGTPRTPRTRGKRRRSVRSGGESAAKQPDPSPVVGEPTGRGTPDAGPLIVGVGGSAGSLTPLRALLAAVPADCGMAFVIVSHQAPTGHSMLPDILAKCTEMPVREITDETRVEPDHVYVEPRGHNVVIREGTLSLDPVTLRETPHLPIDLFFRTLARDQGSRAAGIVLSGTGTDGTLGLAAIRAASGLSLVQDPATAEFDGMPLSAIQARAADLVVSPAEMPARLLLLRKELARADSAPEIAVNEIQRILAIMRQHGDHDFSEYRHGTLVRRIERRMHLHGIGNLEEYARLLEQSDGEIDTLWHDWLIGVSSFFRDPDAFHALECSLPELLAGRQAGSTLRIWVPGCATGEEAYSLAMVLVETLHRVEKNLQIQVFATDLNPEAIQFARAGRYPEGTAANIGEARLARFCTREDGFYRVRKELRDLIVFAVQDVLHDPPFTRVDLLSCRNLLIYLEPSAQRRLLRSFHYGLNPRGLLLLGSSENATGSEEFFSPLDAHFRVYRRNDSTAPQLSIRWPAVHRQGRNDPTAPRPVGTKADLANPLSRALAERFGPPAVLVDAAGGIQQIHGNIGAYLRLPAGRVNVNVVDMARGGLRAPLDEVLREASESHGAVVERSARLRVDGARLTVHLKVAQLHEPRLAAPLFLISFEPKGRKGRKRDVDRKSESTADGSTARRGARLDRELRDMRHDLHGTIDELQAANEELAAANEEVQSANEELQSTNEELQTAKEETQSLNEELHTVNAELTQKLESFERATDDLSNLMNNIEVATIFLDSQLRVMRFTPQARRVAHLIDADIGRPMADLATYVDYPDLLSDAADVIETLHASEKHASAPDGSSYLVRIRPYRTAQNVVEGAVVTFFDITHAGRSERAQAARILAESIVDAVREPILVLDDALRVVRANRAYYRTFGAEPENTRGRLIGDLGLHQWSTPMLRQRLEKALQEGTGFDDLEVETELPHLGRRRLLLNARPVATSPGSVAEFVLLGIQETSEPQADASKSEGERP